MSTQTIEDHRLIYSERLPGGRNASFILKRGRALRITDIEGGGNVSALFFNAREKLERYNMADTLKAQHTAVLAKGLVCYSDMGRILVSIIEDTCGWQDTVCGVTDAALVLEKYGVARYQEHRNDFYRNGRELFLIELGKWGLDTRDLVPNVNFFSKVTVDDEGRLRYVSGHSKPGDFVDLRAEMDTLVVLNTCQHPLDPEPHYAPRPADLSIWAADPVAGDDLCRVSRPENARGFRNTEIWIAQTEGYLP